MKCNCGHEFEPEVQYRHRIVCGDSTDKEVVAAVMDGEKAIAMWTDPPYGVSYVGKTKNELVIGNDGAKDLPDLLRRAFATVTDFLEPGSPFYIAAPAGPMGTVFRLALQEAEWRFHQALVWVKSSMVLGHSDYHYRHEDILYGWTPGQGRSGRGDHAGSKWYGDHCQTTVLEHDKPSRNEEHPTMKPISLILQCLSNSTAAGHLVIDPFLGSGSTLIACERTNRRCRGVELAPKYLAVCLERFFAETGLTPVRVVEQDT